MWVRFLLPLPIDFSNEEICLAVQLVNNRDVFIEMEDTSKHNKKYDSIEEMKMDFNSVGLWL